MFCMHMQNVKVDLLTSCLNVTHRVIKTSLSDVETQHYRSTYVVVSMDSTASKRVNSMNQRPTSGRCSPQC